MTTRELITNIYNLTSFSKSNKPFITNSTFYYHFINLEGTIFNKRSDECDDLLYQFNVLGSRTFDDLNKELEKCPVIKMQKLNNQQVLFLIAMYEKNGNAFIMRLQQVSPNRIKALMEGLYRYCTIKSVMGRSVNLLIIELELVYKNSLRLAANKIAANINGLIENKKEHETLKQERNQRSSNNKRLKDTLSDDINF